MGADKTYDTQEFVEGIRARGITPHFARNTAGRRSAIDDVSAENAGYAMSQQIRKKIEQGFSWTKTLGALRKLTRRGLRVVKKNVACTLAAYNLVRIGGIEKWWEPTPT